MLGELATIPHAHCDPMMIAYLEYLVLRGRVKSARTVAENLGQFARWCGANAVQPLTANRAQLEAYQVWLTRTYHTPKGQPLARTTLAVRIANVKAWYGWLDDRGQIVVNPARTLLVRVPRSRVVIREHLSLQEVTALLQAQAEYVLTFPVGSHYRAVHQRNLALLAVAIATGRRIGGLMTLQVQHIDLERLEVRVEREKGRQGRVLPIAEWAVAILRAYLVQARPRLAGAANPWLFADRAKDAAITTAALAWCIRDVVARTIAANPDLTELPAKTITWHSLRVTFATMLFANGCPIRSIFELMLHRNLSTTAQYTPIPIEDMQAVWRTAHPRR